jgi:large subunit ribosomal protein L20
MQFAYRDRRNKKRTLRSTWNTRINAAARINGTSYSILVSNLKLSNINLDRKILSELATNYPDSFKAVVETAVKKK